MKLCGYNKMVNFGLRDFRREDFDSLWPAIRPKGWIVDVKSILDPAVLPEHVRYWSL